MKLVIENQILSSVEIYNHFINSDILIIEMHDNYQKRSYRNRFIISGPSGSHTISIPLKKGKNSLMSSQVQISHDMPWVRSLAITIQSYYGSAPFFDHYFHGLTGIFQKKHSYLFELNNELRDYIFKSLNIGIQVIYTDRYIEDYGEGHLDLRDKFSPLKSSVRSDKIPSYNQVFEDKFGFIPGLSIIDLLFNKGNYAYEYLVSQPSK